MAVPAADPPPNFPPAPPEPATSAAHGGVALLGWSLRNLRLLFLQFVPSVEDSGSQQPLQDGLVHPQLGSDAALGGGEDRGVSAQRAADDETARGRKRAVVRARCPAQEPEAALTEAVDAAQLPGAAATRVVGPVTNSTLELWPHVRILTRFEPDTKLLFL